ncbi:NUDIX domain-containing protein [Enterocloster lavalensis]|uniref:NUDIX domain-containing protein n=1 Tax=Enterocloster lavalensis TaxID=460384 RepID=UPI002A80D09B|nr:NUDIX domain-containing protein [Enterocloster lavalensis]
MCDMKLTTLCYIERENAYLMLHRVSKEHDVNKDKWIGVGGHFEAGESPEECVLREVKEETGLTLLSWQFRGVITFSSEGWEDEYICLFTADRFSGELTACNEGVLEWVDQEAVLKLNLWEGDKIFFRLLNEKRPFFSLKLSYRENRLVYAALDGRELELFDVRDSEGNVTGVARERELVHLNGDPHGTSHIWVVRENASGGWDVLLQKRSRDKDSYPDCYDVSSAGHLQAGDDFLPAALRELEEELGLRAQAEDLEFVGFRRAYREAFFCGRLFKDHEISAVYIYRKPVETSALRLQKEELESVMWMDLVDCRRAVGEGSLDNCMYPEELEMLSRRLSQGK